MSDTAAPRVPTLSHRLEYWGARALVAALQLIGWRAASWVGGQLGRFAYRPLGIRAGVVERQIAAAFPQWSPAEVRTIAGGSYESLGRTSIEMACLPGTPSKDILARIERVDGWEHVEAGLGLGRGIVVVTGHIGNWELIGAYIAARGFPVEGVARGMANPVFDAYVTRTRESLGMTVIHDRDAVRRTPRALKANRMIGFVSDHDALGLASTFVPFFGRPAKTPRGPAVFALRYEAPVLFLTMTRQPSGRYRLDIAPIVVVPTGDKERDIDAIVLRFTEMLEDKVRQYPAQYFWQHRRWRRQPPDTPPHLREP